MDLRDKAVVVTRASMGIGLATACEFVNAGIQVMLATRSEKERFKFHAAQVADRTRYCAAAPPRTAGERAIPRAPRARVRLPMVAVECVAAIAVRAAAVVYCVPRQIITCPEQSEGRHQFGRPRGSD